MPNPLLEHLISTYSDKGDTVLDPFAGYGTTLEVAETLSRTPIGVEIDEEKVKYMRNQGMGEYIIHSDIRRLVRDFPPIDLCISSPPYMGKNDTANALTGYRYRGTYEEYLDELVEVYEKIASHMVNGGIVVVESSNLKHEDEVTTLAWDIGKRLDEVMNFQGELIVTWEGEQQEDGIYGYGYDHSYCHIFTTVSKS